MLAISCRSNFDQTLLDRNIDVAQQDSPEILTLKPAHESWVMIDIINLASSNTSSNHCKWLAVLI